MVLVLLEGLSVTRIRAVRAEIDRETRSPPFGFFSLSGHPPVLGTLCRACSWVFFWCREEVEVGVRWCDSEDESEPM